MSNIVDPLVSTCKNLQSRISSTQSIKVYWNATRNYTAAEQAQAQLDQTIQQYNQNGCDAVIAQDRGAVVASFSDAFQQIDKARIEEESKYQAKQKIFFGVLILVGALVMVTMFSKKETT